MAVALIFFDAGNEEIAELILQLVEAGHQVQVHPIEELQLPQAVSEEETR